MKTVVPISSGPQHSATTDRVTPLSVALACSNRWNSALTEYVVSAARALNAAGVPVTVIGLRNSPLLTRVTEAAISTLSTDSFEFRDFLNFSSLIRGLRSDVLITFGGPETFFANLACALRFFSTELLRFRGDDRFVSHPPSALRERWNHTYFSHFVAPNELIAARLRHTFGAEHVSRIALGIDGNKFVFRWEADQSRRPDLIILARLDPVKGHIPLIRTFAATKKHLAGMAAAATRLKIIGQPANLSVNDLRTVVAESGMHEGADVVFIDQRVTDISTELQGGLAGVVASTGSEVICRVAQEYLMSGLPIIVSPVGALSECVIERGSAIVDFARNDAPLQLAEFLRAAWAETTAERASRATMASERYGLSVMGAQLQQMVERVAHRSN